MSESSDGHAFLSYVREDTEDVNRIQRLLEVAGISVWRDTKDLWPGEDWKIQIRQAITNWALAFIACFSDHSNARMTTYQNEELVLAIDELRKRPPDKTWLIPVRLSECKLPEFNLGAGRTLDSLQRVDLFGDKSEEGLARLVAGVLRALPSATPSSRKSTTFTAYVKSALLDDSRQIELEDLVVTIVEESVAKLTDAEEFPSSSVYVSNDVTRHLVEQANRYWSAVAPVCEVLVAGCAWGRKHHNRLWSRAIERIANTAKQDSGMIVLRELRRYPVLPVLYAGGIAAVHRGNYSALKALTMDARVRRENDTVPLIGVSHVWGPFSTFELAAHVLAIHHKEEVSDDLIESLRDRRRGRLFTPVSDHLHDRLRDPLRIVVADDEEFTDTFDRLEVMFALIATDAKLQAALTNRYLPGAWYGSFTWRHRHDRPGLEGKVFIEFQEEGAEWPLLRDGLFGGSVARAQAAFATVIKEAEEQRNRRG